MAGSTGDKVELYVYDLTSGIAKYLGPLVVNKHVEGVWHTSIVVRNKEYTYGQDGINILNPPGKPLKAHLLGETSIPDCDIQMFIDALTKSEFLGENYDLFCHNCHVFSNKLCQFLCNKDIPHEYLKLPEAILGKDPKAGAKKAAVTTSLKSSGALASSSMASAGLPEVLGAFLLSNSIHSSSCRKKKISYGDNNV